MENNKLITREYFNNEYLSEVTMIQDEATSGTSWATRNLKDAEIIVT